MMIMVGVILVILFAVELFIKEKLYMKSLGGFLIYMTLIEVFLDGWDLHKR
jgi:hypothetical protein